MIKDNSLISHERLKCVSISEGSAKQLPWGAWSETDDFPKKSKYQVMLESRLGRQFLKRPYTFCWGTVGASYDPRSGSSAIVINYKQELENP